MHMGRVRKLVSEQNFSGVAAGGADLGSGTGAATTNGAGAPVDSATAGVRGASNLASLILSLRAPTLAFLSNVADAGRFGVLLSMMVSMGSFLPDVSTATAEVLAAPLAAVATGVVDSMVSSGRACVLMMLGATAWLLADQLCHPQAAATTLNSAKGTINTHSVVGHDGLVLPCFVELRALFLRRATGLLSMGAGTLNGSRDRVLRSTGFSSGNAGVLSGPQLAITVAASSASSASSSVPMNCVGA